MVRSDGEIYRDACHRLLKDPDVDDKSIHLYVNQGIVYLTGVVSSRDIKKLVESDIEDITGIKDIQNQIIVKT